MAAAPRGFEIAQVDQGIIRSHHPKEECAGLSVPPKYSGKAGLTARGLARVLPPARTPRAPGSPWWPRAGCPPPRAFSRGRLGRAPATQPSSPHRSLPEKIELPSAGPKSPPTIEFLGPTIEPVRRMEKSGRVGLSAPSSPIQGTRLLAQAMPPASAVPFWPINPFGGAHQMENVRRTRLPLSPSRSGEKKKILCAGRS